MGSVGCLHLEGAIRRPKIHAVLYTGASSFVDLNQVSYLRDIQRTRGEQKEIISFTYHLCRLGTGNVELKIGILLPVAEKQWKLEEKSVVSIAQGSEGLRTGVPIETTLLSLASTDKFLPRIKVVGVCFLDAPLTRLNRNETNVMCTYHLQSQLLDLGILLIRGRKLIEVRHFQKVYSCV